MRWNPLRRAREAREAEFVAADRWRIARKLADEDVTVLGEQLADLHVDTLATELDDAATHHYRRALEHYEQAKVKVGSSHTAEDILGVEQLLADARFHRAAVLALEAGEPLPERREPCFFDPRHGPSMSDVEWTPPYGVARTVAVCAADARRLEGGLAPEIRMVRIGDRYAPAHEIGGIADVLKHYQHLDHERSMSHNRTSVAEAYIDIGANRIGGDT